MSTALFDLSGRTALVTGSSRGLGRAIAEGMAKAGAKIIINGVDPKRVEQAVAEFRAAGHQAEGAAFNVTDEPAIVAAFERFDREGHRGRHPRQQCRHPAPQAAGRVHHRRMAQGDRDQPHQRLRDRPRGRPSA